MEFKELIEARYSCRKFKDTPVDQKKLDAVLEAGNVAPTGKNKQSQRILVVRNEEGLEAMKECTPCHFNAPVVLVVCYDSVDTATNDISDNKICGPDDAAITLTHMMLACYEEGLGNTWVAYMYRDKLREAFNIPTDYEILALMPIGYPAEDAAPSPRHTQRKPLEGTVTYDSF